VRGVLGAIELEWCGEPWWQFYRELRAVLPPQSACRVDLADRRRRGPGTLASTTRGCAILPNRRLSVLECRAEQAVSQIELNASIAGLSWLAAAPATALCRFVAGTML